MQQIIGHMREATYLEHKYVNILLIPANNREIEALNLSSITFKKIIDFHISEI